MAILFRLGLAMALCFLTQGNEASVRAQGSNQSLGDLTKNLLEQEAWIDAKSGRRDLIARVNEIAKLGASGKIATALQKCQEFEDLFGKEFGENSEEIAVFRMYAGSIFLSAGDSKTATENLASAVELLRTHNSQSFLPNALRRYANALVSSRASDSKLVESLLTEASSLTVTKHGADSYQAAETYQALGEFFIGRDPEKATKFLTNALSILRTHQNPKQPDVILWVYRSLAKLNVAKDPKKAVEYARESYEGIQKIYPKSGDLVLYANTYCLALLNARNASEIEKVTTYVFSKVENISNASPYEVARLRLTRGYIYLTKDLPNPTKGELLMREGLTAYRALAQPPADEVIMLQLSTLAGYYIRMSNEPDKGLEVLNDAIECGRKIPKFSAPIRYVALYVDVAQIYKAKGNRAEATRYFDKASEASKAVFGAGSQEDQKTQKIIEGSR